jgi:hypothetical protein
MIEDVIYRDTAVTLSFCACYPIALLATLSV